MSGITLATTRVNPSRYVCVWIGRSIIIECAQFDLTICAIPSPEYEQVICGFHYKVVYPIMENEGSRVPRPCAAPTAWCSFGASPFSLAALPCSLAASSYSLLAPSKAAMLPSEIENGNSQS